MAVTVDATKGAYIIPALAGSGYVPLGGGTMTGALTINTGAVSTSSAVLTGYLTIGNDATIKYTGITHSTGLTFSSVSGGYLSVKAYAFLDPNGAACLGDSGRASGSGLSLSSGASLMWGSANSYGGTTSLALFMDAAATLAQRNGTNAQTLRVYGTYTDANNYERLALTTTAGASVNISAETLGTGADDIDLVLTAAGLGFVRIPVATGATNPELRFGATGTVGIRHQVSNGWLTFRAVNGSVQTLTIGTGIARIPASATFCWTDNIESAGGTTDTGFNRGAAGQVDVTNGTAATYRDLKLRNLLQTAYHEVTEMTAPSAPATNSVRIYAEDNGSGKTRLMALFASGAAQQIAIEP